ncbi:uncharacterized protein LOC127698786 [Mytilus californianus]|uniref:uncharacterized protein LOC127698786 n=1 Tax=Mytilus californianus TaxID=6549 RepID=UPI00224666EA|nr:uncharacterized protein LOC127698786 [Mytilus californianus]XP_052058410.1 uncharacterized protein LOC127698786 [Mytilus californianus]
MMPPSSVIEPIPCVCIGEGNLLLCCLKNLAELRFNVITVFTNTPAVRKYCEDGNICHWERGSNMEEVLKDAEFDYLFSISNPRIIKENVLGLPRVMSINYHDSPLPAYAGVHSTSWAIMNGELKHGISWHLIEVGIDTGDILQFKEVTVADNDSALTLNLKCQEAAKQAFINLLSDIRNDTVERQTQPQVGRSYFGLYAIPPNAGVLSFDSKSQEIYNIARSLEFGNHDNALSSPKIVTASGEFLLVTNVEPARGDIYKSGDPGCILDIVDDTLVVSTSDKPLFVSFAYLDGTHPLQNTYKDHSLYTGAKLTTVNLNTDALVHIKKKEQFWRNKMAVYEPTTFFRQRMNVVAGIIDVSTEINVKTAVLQLPNIPLPVAFEDVNDYLSAAFLAFMARICCLKTVCVGILADKDKIPDAVLPLYSDICPGLFKINIRDELSSILHSCHESLQKHHSSHSFLMDMFYRYPELRGRKQVPHHNIVLGSLIKKSSERAFVEKVLHDCNILLLFENFGTEMHLLYNERPSQDFEHIKDVLKHFPTFLKSMVEIGNDAKLSEVSMVSTEEMRKLYPVYTYPETKAESPFTAFETQCRVTPRNIALTSTQCSMTYKQCYNEVKRLAKLISDRDLSPQFGNKIVALHLPNSLAYVISVMAAVHADKAFLPLPLDYPPERLGFTMKDADVNILIMTTETYERSDFTKIKNIETRVGIVGDEDIVIVEFKAEDKSVARNQREPKRRSSFAPLDDDICYIMYTSGSTGRPKGVQVTKTGVLNLSRAQIELWSLKENDIIAQFASIGFDATISEIFTALFSGATLAVLRENERLGQEFVVSMNKLKVNTITLPPSALNVYKPSDLPYLEKVITAGEPCTLNTAVKWTSSGKDIQFFNAYGPTETTVCATNYKFNKGLGHEDVNRDIPIGKGIPGACVYLFDEFLQPVPPDVVGEIYVGGLGLSKGYIGHASHYNTDKFIRNPLLDEMLLYKTGDHAFQDPDGTLTYIGRLDDMVKIRGQRVDLSEIEQVLIQHPKIDIAVVVVHRCQKLKEMSIAAYVSPTFVYTSELKEYLTKVLPKYMIPTYIKKLEVIDYPMTLNGKIDRKLLEKDESVHEQQQYVGSSHLNETQLAISKLWCNLLKFEESFAYTLHRQSSFTELGGNSLQLVLLQRILEEKLSVKLSFTDLGTADTVEEFAEVIKRKKDVLRKSSQCPTKDKHDLRDLILKDAQIALDDLARVGKKGSVQFQYFSPCTAKCNFKYPRNILISGVTGFLGAYLLSQLLEQTNAHICCMVRETTEARGLGRIIENLRRYNLWKFSYSTRVAVVISDLSQEKLGIAPDIYNALCNAIDVVFMNAAMMNFNTNYEDHRIANVDSTKEFVKFAMTGVQKYIFQTSSLSVFLFPPEPKTGDSQHRMCYESEFFDDPCTVEGGYGQSKWASEKIVMEAIDHLPGGAIFRPARISGCSVTGSGPKNDLFASTLIGMRKLGYYPDMDFPFDLTPVDFCAKAMVEIAVRICNETNGFPKAYHLFNSKTFPFRDIFKGMNVIPLPLNDWREKLKTAPEEYKELIPLTPFFMSQFWDRAAYWPIFDTSNTDKIISKETKDLMLHSAELLQVYKRYFGIS